MTRIERRSSSDSSVQNSRSSSRSTGNALSSSAARAKHGSWTGISSKSTQVLSSLAKAEDTDDRFQQLMEELAKEHQTKIQELRKENMSLRRQLNAVLSAQWRVAEDRCQGSLKSDGELILSSQSPEMDQRSVRVQTNEESLAGIEKGVAFQLRQVWVNPDAASRRSARVGADDGRGGFEASVSHKPSDMVVGQSDSCMGSLITFPFSTKRVIWDLMSTILFLYDLVFLPISAFDPLDATFFVIMDIVTLFFWTADIAASFLTGYMSEGVAIMSPSRIAKHYLLTWLIPDLLIVGLDWTFSFIGFAWPHVGDDNTGNVSRLLRVLRVARIIRLLRLGKLRRLMSLAKDHIKSEVVFLVLAVVQYVIILLGMNHLIGAAWWTVSTMNKEEGIANWIDDNELAGRPLYYRYITAVHWSMGNFALGTMATEPQNSSEHTYAICVLVFGMIVFITFTGSVTNKMMQLRDLQGETSKQLWLLRRYLHQHNVPQTLIFRILRYTEYATASSKDKIQQSSLSILGVLSEQLRSELDYIVSFSRLHSHPLFKQGHETSEATMHKLTSKALSLTQLASEDVLFEEGLPATRMYYVVNGMLAYSKPNECERLVAKDDWLAEHALWVPWYHRGDASAITECPVISVDATALGEAVKVNARLWSLMAGYATNFVAFINAVPLEELTDFCAGGEDGCEACLRLMPTENSEGDAGGKPARRSWGKLTGARRLELPAGVAPRSPRDEKVEPPGTMPPPLQQVRFE